MVKKYKSWIEVFVYQTWLEFLLVFMIIYDMEMKGSF